MKIHKKSVESNRGIHGIYTIETERVNQLVGELLTIIDAMGLQNNQEKSIKDLVKQKIWAFIGNGFYLDGKIFTLAEDIKWEIDDESNKQLVTKTTISDRKKGLHPEWINGDYELIFTSK